MSNPSDSQAFDLLESALDQAFSSPPVLPEREAPATTSTSSVQVETHTESSLESSVSDESWKAEYEAQVQSWRAQSAEAREKAEKERLKWESIRAIEREEAAKRRAAGFVDEPATIAGPSKTTSELWESVGEISAATTAASSTPAELVELEPEAPSTAPKAPAVPKTQQTPPEELHKWQSVAYPDMSFPEKPAPRSAPAPGPASVSPSIFDSSLSTRTRVVAVFSALAVNLLLPFVNGVMLGFGEIFAKNVVMGWLGWKSPSVANVGIRSSREERKRNF